MDMENCEFRESMEILGQITWREIKWFTASPEQIQLKKSMYGLYKDAASYYKSALKKNPQIKKYLTDRGMQESSIEKFHFWYADSGVGLYNYLREKWYEETLIADSQIFLDTRSKKDKFIGRVIFPIQNLRGDFVAFAGRITWSGEPKYINSPASKIYDKSAILYGLYDARNSITKQDFVIITEGYMDTIALHEAWYTNTVAISWTALTTKHIQMLSRLTHKIYLCFDNDKAGENATKSSLEILKNKGLEVKIIVLKWWKDPDEILKSGKDFQELIDNALSPIAFYIQTAEVNTQSIDEKKKFLTEVLSIVKSYSDNIEKDAYIKEISQLLWISVPIIYDELKKTKSEKLPQTQNQAQNLSQEDIAIGYILHDASFTKIIMDALVFPEALSPELTECMNDPEWFLEWLEIDKKSRYQALSISHSEQQETRDIQNFLKKLNLEHYKKLAKNLKIEMQQGNGEALKNYTQVLQKAKEHQLK